VASDDTKFSSQSLDRRSFNDTYGLYEHLMYENEGNGNVGAVSQERPHVYYTWVAGELTQKVETYTDRTVTTVYTWVGGLLTERTVTVT
jgi:hypothetical protein